jgi:regulator of extracellular matrix RemA (YlzA/DUF370 family)
MIIKDMNMNYGLGLIITAYQMIKVIFVETASLKTLKQN